MDGQGRIHPTTDGAEQLERLLESFFTQPALTVGTAKELAQRMAGMTRNLRDLIIGTFAQGSDSDKKWLQSWLTAFQEVLIPDLDEKQFADMFAQTLAYGLFAAKVHSGSGKDFSRDTAARCLPKTNPFLRKLFEEFAGVSMPETFDWAVDDLVELLKHAAMDEILKDFGKGKGKEDPVVHFYETFLTAYDPKTRELRGVYYTPEPVVSYIVRSIDHLLKTRFDRPKGLADENTLILDPATGTATFLYFVVRQIYDQFSSQKGAWDSYVEQHLLNRLFGFELLMAPYAIAHLKLGMELQETGYTFGSDQRLGIYLTNTLEEAAKKSEKLFAQWISDEANAAAEVKRDLPIMVVLGNPPYSGISANRGQWITELLKDYRVVDGEPLGEKKVWLADDYVKFIRFGQWRIERSGQGILAFITNHGYLDNPTFRGMRRALIQAFSHIYVLDLHGSSKKKQKPVGDGRDENVFDIQQGVSIGIFVNERQRNDSVTVQHSELWGTREEKYAALGKTDISSTRWYELKPTAPYYFFVPRSEEHIAEYQAGWNVQSIFPVNTSGIVTARDGFAVALDKAALRKRIAVFRDKTLDDALVQNQFSLTENYAWRIASARKELMAVQNWESYFRQVQYRPFDIRSIYYHPSVVWRPREEIMEQMGPHNLAMSTTRRVEISRFEHVSCTRHMLDHHAVSLKEVNYLFPLYLRCHTGGSKPGQSQLALDEASRQRRGLGGWRPNLNPAFVAEVENRLALTFVPDGGGNPQSTFGPADMFNYVYAVLHSPTYRTRYAEFLKSDFPRLPLTSYRALFAALVERGAELVALHLMESPRLDNLTTTFPEKGSNVVERVTYVPATRRVSINGIQYFQGVPREVWEFHVGGYQVCEKWLKDRKGRTLTFDDTQHYQKIVVALKETIRLMTEIDQAIDAHGGWPLK